VGDFSFFDLMPLRHQSRRGGRGFGLQLEEDGDVIPIRNDLLHVHPHYDLQEPGQGRNIFLGVLLRLKEPQE
jgi:hypothetical protein